MGRLTNYANSRDDDFRNRLMNRRKILINPAFALFLAQNSVNWHG